jgi:Tol biopolymer transport system component
VLKKLDFIWIIAFILTMTVSCQQTDVPARQVKQKQVMAGSYLGMEPPGDVPVLFAPGVVADKFREHSGAIFSPDGLELFWSLDNLSPSVHIRTVLYMKQVNGEWTEPEIAPFVSGVVTHINSFLPDGRRIYFSGKRKVEENVEPVFKTWIVEKTQTGWDKFILDPFLNDPATRITDVQEANSGNRYGFGTINAEEEIRGLMISRLVEGKYLAPEPLWHVGNPDHLDHSITIDPDERFVIFASRRPGEYSAQDLYISYRQADGSWGVAVNLGQKINTIGDSLGWPHLSPDGKYLFFVAATNPYKDFDTREFTFAELKEIGLSVKNGLSNIYWVSTSFVEEHRQLGMGTTGK